MSHQPVEVFETLHGVRSEVRINDDSIEVKRTQRVDRIIDGFRQQSETPNRRAASRIGARVPIETYNAWRDEWRRHHADRWEWPTFLVMRLNDSDYKYLRNQKL